MESIDLNINGILSTINVHRGRKSISTSYFIKPPHPSDSFLYFHFRASNGNLGSYPAITNVSFPMLSKQNMPLGFLSENEKEELTPNSVFSYSVKFRFVGALSLALFWLQTAAA